MQRRETLTKRVEFSVPVAPDDTMNHNVMVEMIQTAVNEYWRETGQAPGAEMPGDAVKIDNVTHPDGTKEYVIFYELVSRK
jgi:hypothetical protein